MTNIDLLSTCETLDDLAEMIFDSRPRSSRWGGWLFVYQQQTFSEAETIQRLNAIFQTAHKDQPTAEATLKIIGRIKELNRTGRDLIESWYMLLLTRIEEWLFQLKNPTRLLLDQIEFQAHALHRFCKTEEENELNLTTKVILEEKDVRPTKGVSHIKPLVKKENPAPQMIRYPLDLNPLEIDPFRICKHLFYLKTLDGKHLICSTSDDQKMTVRDYLAFVASSAQVPVDTMRTYGDGKLLNDPSQLDHSISDFPFFIKQCCHLLVVSPLSPDTIKEMNRIIAHLPPHKKSYASFEDFESDLLKESLYYPNLKMGAPALFDKINEFLSVIETGIDYPHPTQQLMDFLTQLKAFMKNCENYPRGGTLKKHHQAEFSSALEAQLYLYPAISCQPNPSKATLQLTHKGSGNTFSFDKEALQSQLGNGELNDFFSAPDAKEIEINVSQEIFECLCDYLNQGTLTRIGSLNEESLLKLYVSSLNHIIPRLEVECALEIAKRLINGTWNNRVLLDPYLQLPGTLLGKLYEVNPI